MALDTLITGANLDAGGNVKTALSQNPLYTGGVRLFSENDPGDILGTPSLRSPETSSDYRLRVGLDSVWDDDNFNYTAQNFNKHKYTSTTMTMTWAGGFLNTNAIASAAAGNACQIQTYRHFPLQGAGGLYCEVAMALSNTPVTNSNIDFGLFLPAATGASIPLDGVYFRINSGGVIGVLNNNGVETTVATTFSPTINKVYKYNITVTDTGLEFWVDDVLYGEITRPVGAGSSMYAGSNPFSIRHHNTGIPSATISAKFANYTIGVADMDNLRLWASNKAGQGMSGVNYPSGGTAGGTATATNVLNTVPGTVTLTASTAPATNALGGSFVFAAPAGTESDFPLFAFLNPAPTTSITGRNLVVRGVWVDTWNQVAAVATTPTIMQFSVATGSTASSLATVDGATSRLPKRVHLGVQSYVVGAAIGFAAPRIDANFDAPLVVEPGCYFHIILRIPVGTATATETFRGAVGVNAYWE